MCNILRIMLYNKISGIMELSIFNIEHNFVKTVVEVGLMILLFYTVPRRDRYIYS